jgi:fatty-acyl-CoA synthase
MEFDGYWKRPEATADAFIDFSGKRFFRTGDLGRMDDDGYFFLTDRLKRMSTPRASRSGRPKWRR